MAKQVHYDFLNTPSLTDHTRGLATPDLSITRTTKRRMTDADGWVRELQAGEAAFTGATFSHNKLTIDSQDLSSTGWVTVRASAAGDATTDPNGGSTASSISEDGTAANNHYLEETFISPVPAGHTAMVSVYLKASNRTWAALHVRNYSSQDHYQYVNLSTGAAGTASGASLVDSGVEDAGGGWYRVWIVCSNGAVLSRIHIAEADNDQLFDGLSQESIYAWGFQLEDVSGAWASENLLLQSNQFDTTWTNSNSSETGGQSDPFGGTDAWLLVDDATAGSHYLSQAIATTIGHTYVFSVYAKANTLDYVGLWGEWSSNGKWFDLANGTVLGNLSSAPEDAGIEDVGNGWYRLYIRDTATVASSSFRFYLSEDGATQSYSGSSQSVVLYGAQVEHNKPNQTGPGTYTATTTAAVTNYSPSTYIPTTTAAASSLTGTSTKGLLVEEARTNTALQSEDFSTTWTTSDTSVSTNQTTAPDGSTTADAIVEAATTNPHYITQTVTTTDLVAITYSVFAKANTRSSIGLYSPNQAEGKWFDISAGTVGSDIVGAPDSSGIEDYGNGWYRCWIVFTEGAAANEPMRIYISNGENLSYAGDGTSSVYLWGAQAEVGAFPTSYIPTTTTSVTRNADQVSTTDVSWFNGITDTWYVNASTVELNVPRATVIAMVGAANSRDADIAIVNPNIDIFRDESVTMNDNTGGASLADNTFFKVAVAFAENDCQTYVNGVNDATDASTAAFTKSATSLRLGYYVTASDLNGHIAEIAYFDERLPNATLDSYSTNGLPTVPTGFLYPRDAMPTDEARFHTYITNSGVTQTGDLQTDYRNAMASALGVTPSNNYSLNDLAKRLDEQ